MLGNDVPVTLLPNKERRENDKSTAHPMRREAALPWHEFEPLMTFFSSCRCFRKAPGLLQARACSAQGLHSTYVGGMMIPDDLG